MTVFNSSITNILRACELNEETGVVTYESLGDTGWGSVIAPRNELSSLTGRGGGEWCNIVVGVGTENYTYLYSPLSRSVWMYLSSKIGFRVSCGKDLGVIKINILDLMTDFKKTREIQVVGAALFRYSGMKQPEFGEYTDTLAYRDFKVDFTEVFISS